MPPKDPLACLDVIELLEVGEPRLERKRLVAPYRVTQNGEVSETELAYRYEDEVFDPGEPGCLNLASMMAAQVALNYGLFCRRIVLHGVWDDHDRRFLEAMLQNTAREIFVHKLLLKNPFIGEPANELPAVKRKWYARATLELESTRVPGRSRPWEADPRRHGILSSGGKDSLLTFGLLRELGKETHPIFVNESGRHWFTALNAHRHFEAQVPNTARVWTNADRLFSWMLRRLPFVRQDFANVRSDGYPIRLWTVAVFLFGALPLLRKRRAGRLLLGDEYDSTQVLTHEGITHYAGYYDQSRLFDDALSRYFQKKGWGISQFSILRPLSELLIEKTLAERYPDLLRQQTSCHATHTVGKRVLPCGKCEKCRRIVGMLSAIDVDPGQCGYNPEQTEACLRALGDKGVHQERPGAEHLAFLLSRKGLLATPIMGPSKPRERPEVEKLRFDSQRSPPSAIPRDLRVPLWSILLEHARGAIQRRGRVWVDFDVLNDREALESSYPFETKTKAAEAASDHVLGDLTWPEAERRLSEVDLALLPVGSIEQHGPHLPLDTDSFDANFLARAVAAACRPPRPLVLPLVPYGVAYHHQDFPGTVSVGPDTLSRLVHEIGVCLARQGITKLVIINGHGGNTPALKFAAQLINRDAHIFTAVDTGETSDTDIAELTETPSDVHAGEIETSTALATRPHLVNMEQATRFVPEFSSRYLDFSSKRSVEWYAHTSKLSATGVLGDPSRATAEKGKHMWDVMIRNLVDFVEQLKGMTLDEIYQKRY